MNLMLNSSTNLPTSWRRPIKVFILVKAIGLGQSRKTSIFFGSNLIFYLPTTFLRNEISGLINPYYLVRRTADEL